MNTFTVIYRKGGTDNFKWHRVLDSFPTRDAANTKAGELERAGYPAKVFNTSQLDAVGMPETYE